MYFLGMLTLAHECLRHYLCLPRCINVIKIVRIDSCIVFSLSIIIFFATEEKHILYREQISAAYYPDCYSGHGSLDFDEGWRYTHLTEEELFLIMVQLCRTALYVNPCHIHWLWRCGRLINFNCIAVNRSENYTN